MNHKCNYLQRVHNCTRKIFLEDGMSGELMETHCTSVQKQVVGCNNDDVIYAHLTYFAIQLPSVLSGVIQATF